MKSKLGDCFTANGKQLIDYRQDDLIKSLLIISNHNMTLCHGYVIGAKGSKVEGLKFAHAWLETDKFFIDFSNKQKIILPKDIVYESSKILTETIIRYTVREAREYACKHGHYGPWDESFDEMVSNGG